MDSQVTRLMGRVEVLQAEVERLQKDVNDWRGIHSNAEDKGMRHAERADKAEAEVERQKDRGKKILFLAQVFRSNYRGARAEIERLRAELEAYIDTLRKQKETADQHADKADMEVGRLMARINNDTDYRDLKKEYESMMAERNGYYADLEKAESQQDKLLETLKRISKGEGAFDLDPLKHAANCIDDMKSIAQDALEKNSKE